jgi:hypothetical protein
MVEVVTSTESRDIGDPTTGVFSAVSVPKLFERQLQFRFEAGTATNFPLPSDPDWRVIGGVFRPAGGGAVSPNHLYDMRRLLDARAISAPVSPGWLTRRSWSSGTPRVNPGVGVESNYKFASFDAEGVLKGQKCWMHVHPTSKSEWVPLQANTCDATNDPRSLATGGWYYMYLCPFTSQSVLPVGQPLSWETAGVVTEQHTSAVRGVLVESTVAPGNSAQLQGGITNSGPVHLPAPFSSYIVQAGEAILLGAFRRTRATGFLGGHADGPKVLLFVDIGATQDHKIADFTSLSGLTAFPLTAGTWTNPQSARTILLRAEYSEISIASTVTISEHARANAFEPYVAQRIFSTDGTFRLHHPFDFEIGMVDPTAAADQRVNFYMGFQGGLDPTDEMQVFVRGFTEGVCG